MNARAALGPRSSAWIVVAVSAVLTVASLSLIPLGFVGFEFIPAVDRGQIFVQINYPSGSPLTVTNKTVSDLSTRFAKIPDVQSVTGTAGISQGAGGGVAIGLRRPDHRVPRRQSEAR